MSFAHIFMRLGLRRDSKEIGKSKLMDEGLVSGGGILRGRGDTSFLNWFCSFPVYGFRNHKSVCVVSPFHLFLWVLLTSITFLYRWLAYETFHLNLKDKGYVFSTLRVRLALAPNGK